ncbi:unnamed protein product [Arctogadus glacialis]
MPAAPSNHGRGAEDRKSLLEVIREALDLWPPDEELGARTRSSRPHHTIPSQHTPFNRRVSDPIHSRPFGRPATQLPLRSPKKLLSR